jgi:hypothetical protein
VGMAYPSAGVNKFLAVPEGNKGHEYEYQGAACKAKQNLSVQCHSQNTLYRFCKTTNFII